MAHTAADGSKWTNAAQAKKVPGRAQGDGKQPVSSFSKPEAPRQPTADPVSASPGNSTHSEDNGTQSENSGVQITHDGNMFTVTAKFASKDEAQQAAQALSGAPDDSQQPQMNPSQAMM